MAARTRRSVLIAMGLLALPLPATAGTGVPPAEWISPHHRDHALAGTIWSAREGRAVARDALVDVLSRAPIVLLGEVHDNPDHHRLRAGIIGDLASGRRQSARSGPAVVFEHIRADQQHIVDRALYSRRAISAEALLKQLEWERSGWPSAAMFAPLFEELLSRVLPILGGNTPGEAIRNVARHGVSALPDGERTRLGLDVELDPPLQQALVAEIESSHCGVLPASAYAPMALAQRYRDAHLAEVLLRAADGHGSAVLLAGNGHVRADRGVPWHLGRRAPALPGVVVAFVEVEPGKSDPGRYLPRDPGGRPAADYLWFTPQAERADDPCEEMRRRSGHGSRGTAATPPGG